MQGRGGVITKLRKSRLVKVIAWALVFIMTVPLHHLVFATGTGPQMPEYSGFQAVQPGEHVDPFTGDFSYTIPLGDIDGKIPLTLSYSSEAVSWESQASWVGLGWNLNTGAIQRTANGIPDDARGDTMRRFVDKKPEKMFTTNIIAKVEILGNDVSGLLGLLKKLKEVGLTIGYNNYKGLIFITSA